MQKERSFPSLLLKPISLTQRVQQYYFLCVIWIFFCALHLVLLPLLSRWSGSVHQCIVFPAVFSLSNHLLCIFKPSVWLVFPSFAPYYMSRTSSASDFFLLSLWTLTDTKKPKSILFCMSQDWTKCFTAWLSNVRDIKGASVFVSPGIELCLCICAWVTDQKLARA